MRKTIVLLFGLLFFLMLTGCEWKMDKDTETKPDMNAHTDIQGKDGEKNAPETAGEELANKKEAVDKEQNGNKDVGSENEVQQEATDSQYQNGTEGQKDYGTIGFKLMVKEYE